MRQLVYLFSLLFFSICAQAQLSETFIDSRNPWYGDGSFTTESGFLRLSEIGNGTASRYIYGAVWGENEWTFRVKSGYKVTSANLFRVYLWSEKKVVDDYGEAYYILIGGNNNRQIAFVHQTGAGKATLIQLKNISNLGGAFDLHFRVVADSYGKVTIYAKAEGKDDFTTIGSTYCDPEPSLGYFMLYCKYSLDHNSDKYFGAIKVKNFDSQTNSVGEEPKEEDLWGEEDYEDEEEIITPTPPKPSADEYSVGDILINEVMANPKGAPALPETEYVELYNTTDRDINLSGWSFIYGGNATMLKSVIPAEGYAVLFREGRDIEIGRGGVGIPLSKFPSALANSGKQLMIISPGRLIIDEYTYPVAIAGYSWERQGSEWVKSGSLSGGTPGSDNRRVVEEEGNEDKEDADEENDITDEVMEGDIIFNEILPNPYAGGSEYIELYNRSGRTLSLKDLAIAKRKADNSLDTHYSLSSIVKPLKSEGFALLTKSIEGVEEFYLLSSPEALHELPLPVLTNTSAKLVLFRKSDGEVIDELHYSEKWHSFSVKDPRGIALERISTEGETQDADNWASALSSYGGGTPGYANSVQSNNSGGSTGMTSPEYNHAIGEYEITYSLDKPGYNCNAYVYNLSGRRVAVIANNQPLSIDGTISWKGHAANGNRLDSGLYLFYAEIYHPQEGRRKVYKKVLLVW